MLRGIKRPLDFFLSHSRCCSSNSFVPEHLRQRLISPEFGAKPVHPRKEMQRQYPDSQQSVTEHFLYSKQSMQRLPWEMYYSKQHRVLWSFIHFQSQSRLGNTQGFAHGGLLSACFDGALGSLFTMTGVSGFTANLNVNYRQPVEIPSSLLLRSHVQSWEGRKLWIAGKLTTATDSALEDGDKGGGGEDCAVGEGGGDGVEGGDGGGDGGRNPASIIFAEGRGLFLEQRKKEQ